MNKAVFITGGQSGTGFGIADFFARQGWNVIVSGQNGVEAKAAARRLAETYGIISTGYELDLRNEQQMIDIFNDICAVLGHKELTLKEFYTTIRTQSSVINI